MSGIKEEKYVPRDKATSRYAQAPTSLPQSQCVTAVENRESTPSKHHTDTALWRVSVNFGFVYEGKDLANAFNLLKK